MILRGGKPEDIKKLYERLNADSKFILKNIIQMVYFMRGAVSYDRALYGMSFVEREIMSDYITSRLEVESKSMNPVY